MAEAQPTKSGPHLRGSGILEVGSASRVLQAQDDHHTSPNHNPLKQLDLFKHDPLNYHGPAIRLVKVRPSKDGDGPVECDIRLTSTDREYICLSYVWGNHEPGDWILMNDKRFWVRQNLLDFLTSARSLVDIQSNWIWIDALCIDQDNLEEREHQVKKMGHIYSCANRVISWLGNDHPISLFLHFTPAGKYTYAGGLHFFHQSPYWERAWITQELVLARRLSFMACKTILHSDQLPGLPNVGSLERWTEHMDFFAFLRTMPRETPLFQLLGRSLHKKCQSPRDRIFSLLALCWDGVNVEVDYTSSSPLLAWKILRSCNHGFCLCSIKIVHRALGLNALSEPCPREFTPAGEYRCASVTLPVLWSEDAPLYSIVDDKNRDVQEDDEAWKLSNISWGALGRPRSGYYTDLQLSRCVVGQGESWLENHLVWWKIQHEFKEESWLVVCISLTSLCLSHTGWLNLFVNVKTSCAHYHVARDPYDERTPWTGVPFLEAKWWPKPGGHVFPVRLSPGARVCKVVLPLNFWHVVSEQHRQYANNTKEPPLEYCVHAVASDDEGISSVGKIRLSLCPEGATPGIYGI